ncbi:hypothetical protein ACLOJK_000214 [Asimina triloba]
MLDLIKEEAAVIKECEAMAVQHLKKLLMISPSGKLRIHSLWLIWRELGLREDFGHSILLKYSDVFTLESPEIVALVSRDERPAIAEIEEGFREKLKNWQRLPYLKPYEKMEVVRARSCGGKEWFEKRAVGILHELLSLTVEKMIDRSNSRGCLIEPNPLYEVRRKVLDLLLLGCRNTRELQPQEDPQEQGNKLAIEKVNSGPCDGDWVIPILGDFNVLSDESHSDDHETSDEENDVKFAGGKIRKDFING